MLSILVVLMRRMLHFAFRDPIFVDLTGEGDSSRTFFIRKYRKHGNRVYSSSTPAINRIFAKYRLSKDGSAVADLGGADGGNCPPFTMKIQLWRPLFGKKSAPYPDPNAVFFSDSF